MSADEEADLARAVQYYLQNNTPLSKPCFQDLVEDYVSNLPTDRQFQIGFLNNRSSKRWVTSFTDRHDLTYRSVRTIDQSRLEAVSGENVSKHIARVQAVMNKYCIREANQVLNLDETGASFSKMTGRSFRKGICKSAHRAIWCKQMLR